MLHKLILITLLTGLLSIGIAVADDMDGNNVIREEHVTAANDENSNSREATHPARHNRDEPVVEAEHGEEIIRQRVDEMEHGAGPDTLALDSLGLYFGLGEQFIDRASARIDARSSLYRENSGAPVYSRLSDTSLGDLATDSGASASHRHSSSSNDDGASDDSGDEDYGLNRRGADHDYFWD